MSWITEFQEAFNDYPSQDNEGFVPERGGFKCGFSSAWHRQEERIRSEKLRACQVEVKLETKNQALQNAVTAAQNVFNHIFCYSTGCSVMAEEDMVDLFEIYSAAKEELDSIRVD